MIVKRLLFLVMAICLANGVKAQFYDSADEIYYYVEYKSERKQYTDIYGYLQKEKTEIPNETEATVMIFNFDGEKAAELTGGANVRLVKNEIKRSPSYYEDKVETSDYNCKYVPSSSGITYTKADWGKSDYYIYSFSSDRNTMSYTYGNPYWTKYFKRVNKNYFKTGRSTTPSSGMYE